ncbi:hypothetical protein GGU10DRAFT_370435 [Lentinula aff. detonsa]|uniref:Uncharacterized protein n=1 Tax=Lentinula aff. detonsa TaxID=2804958 RepID=A0AA38KK12_9AGAR|nr:hypothetical protein GGU10DRAFT_370435 [Lentinula aff. detonsa]
MGMEHSVVCWVSAGTLLLGGTLVKSPVTPVYTAPPLLASLYGRVSRCSDSRCPVRGESVVDCMWMTMVNFGFVVGVASLALPWDHLCGVSVSIDVAILDQLAL